MKSENFIFFKCPQAILTQSQIWKLVLLNNTGAQEYGQQKVFQTAHLKYENTYINTLYSYAGEF